MKRFFVSLTFTLLSFAPAAVQATPFTLQKSATYPAHLWFTLDKLKAAQAALEEQNAENTTGNKQGQG